MKSTEYAYTYIKSKFHTIYNIEKGKKHKTCLLLPQAFVYIDIAL